MPMPKPRDNEERDAFISRCMGDDVMNRDYPENPQRAAVCYTQWRESQREKAMPINDLLLKAVRARGRKLEQFGRGILTADRYVATLLDTFGWDACYKFASQGNVSFHDILTKAADTLVYSNDEMLVEQKARDGRIELPRGVELPKNTLMAFRHVLTTSRQDRDGDVMHSDGAELDPKMLLLWQHVPTMPIGKMLASVEQTKDRVSVISAIVDINELCHDAAVMVDNGMGRFSHGFRALEFAEIKARDQEKDEPGGFDVKRFEVMEESLVSVPANVDAETEEVLLSLVEGGKLTSGVMKEHARVIKDRRPVSVPVKLDLKVTVNGREVQGEEQPGAGAGEGAKGGAAGPSEEAVQGDDAKKAEGADDDKVIEDADVKAEGVKLNAAAAGQARRLIGAGKVKKSGSWSGPTADAGNKYMEANGAAAYGKWFLGIRPGADAETKGAYAYPYTSDFANVDRAGLVAIRVRAGQQGEKDIFDAAGAMIEAIDGKGGEEKGAEMTGEKQGRVLSKANETKIKDARDDVDEARKMEGVARPCKALLQRASGTLGDVLASLGGEPGGEAKPEQKPGPTEKEGIDLATAFDLVINRTNRGQRAALRKTLEAIEHREDKMKNYRALRHGKVRRGGPGGHQ